MCSRRCSKSSGPIDTSLRLDEPEEPGALLRADSRSLIRELAVDAAAPACLLRVFREDISEPCGCRSRAACAESTDEPGGILVRDEFGLDLDDEMLDGCEDWAEVNDALYGEKLWSTVESGGRRRTGMGSFEVGETVAVGAVVDLLFRFVALEVAESAGAASLCDLPFCFRGVALRNS